MTREEFIEAHWEESLVIDAKMREAAVALFLLIQRFKTTTT
jgi:hypothetical protein